MNRRTFIKRGLLGTATALIISATGLALFPRRKLENNKTQYKILSLKNASVLFAFAQRIVPQDADIDAVVKRVDEALIYATIEAQNDFKKLLSLFDNALVNLVLCAQPIPFSWANAKVQDEILNKWRNSSLTLRRGGYQGIRKLCLSAYYADSQSWASIKYPGPPITGGFAYPDSKM